MVLIDSELLIPLLAIMFASSHKLLASVVEHTKDQSPVNDKKPLGGHAVATTLFNVCRLDELLTFTRALLDKANLSFFLLHTIADLKHV